MGSSLTKILYFLYRHLPKVLLTAFLTVVFILLLIETRDFKDRLSDIVAQSSGGRLQILNFEDFGFSVIPLGLSVQGLEIQAGGLAPLALQNLAVSPALGMIFDRSVPRASISASGLFAGALDLDLDKSSTSKPEQPKLDISAELEDLDLKETLKFLVGSIPDISLNADGKLAMKAQLEGFGLFPGAELPQAGVINAQIDQFHLPEQEVSIPMPPPPGMSRVEPMRLNVPTIRWSKSQILAKIDGNKLLIEDVALGSEKDALLVKIRGQVELQNIGGMARMGRSTLNFQISASSQFVEQTKKSGLSLALIYLDKCKGQEGDRVTYKFSADLPAPILIPKCS